MKIKTFIATYLLFLLILFSSIGIVSVYLTNSQITMLENKSEGQFQSIVHTLARDMAVMWGRGDWHHTTFSEAVAERVRGYARYYNRHNVHLSVSDLSMAGQETEQCAIESEIVFINDNGSNFIYISGLLPEPFDHFLLHYTLNITQNITEMREVQNVLLITAAMLSAIAAVALHFILAAIFKPIGVIAKASREIADGQFHERIQVAGKNELAGVAVDFNKMAERVESQITFLEEEAKNKQQFVDNFAHEIRTPLTSIYGYAEYMHKAALDAEEVIESAAYIMDESRHMRNIANSLLELATLRDYTPTMDKISVSRLFDDIMQSMYKPAQEANVRLNCENDNDNNIIIGQEDLIKSLILNLCNNAIKACEPNKGIIEVGATRQQKGVKIIIADNGYGIPEKDIQKIFEPFYRLDKSRNRILSSGSAVLPSAKPATRPPFLAVHGVGLGLTLCKRIVEAHNAKMTIKSEVGNGTTIEIIFTTS